MAIRKLAGWQLFSAFLGLGMLCGFLLGSLGGGSASAKVLAARVQRNLLVVLVEDASAESSPLLGAWLAASSELEHEINWQPIYPTPLEYAGDYSAAHEPLWLAPGDLAALEGLKPLRQAGVWWDQALVLDPGTLNSLMALMGATAGEAIQSWLEPQRALHQQVSAIQSLCATPGLLMDPSALNVAVEALGNHAHLGLSAFDLIAAWDRQQGQPLHGCSHPWAD